MGFIQPCFIRKNTLYLRRKLEELGYKPSYPIFQYPEVFKHIAVCNFFGSKYYGVSDDEVSHHGEIKDAIKNRGLIDCGTNEELFLALAALRDDNDKKQWFVHDYQYQKVWIFSEMECYSDEPFAHKATVEELIEHFKKE